MPLLALVFVLATLVIEALPAIRVNGLAFLHRHRMEPGQHLRQHRDQPRCRTSGRRRLRRVAADRRHPGELRDRPDRRGAGVHRRGAGDRGPVAQTSAGVGRRHGARIARRHPQRRRRPVGGDDVRAVHRPPRRPGDRPQRSRCAGARLLPRQHRQRGGHVGVRSGAGGDDHSDHRQHHPRPAPAGADAAPRGRDRAGHVRLGVRAPGHPAVGVQRHRRRRGAGAGPCAGRDDGRRHGVRARSWVRCRPTSTRR